MFELYYPGNCYGNLDVSAKECKKCKIKQFCRSTNSTKKEDIGISTFKQLLLETFSCESETKEDKTVVTCFKKNTSDMYMTVYFMNNGSVLINASDKTTAVNHIVSKEKAEELLKAISTN